MCALNMAHTCEKTEPNCPLSFPSFSMPLTNKLGIERNRRVWPVGAVSKMTTEKSISLTSLRVHVK